MGYPKFFVQRRNEAAVECHPAKDAASFCSGKCANTHWVAIDEIIITR